MKSLCVSNTYDRTYTLGWAEISECDRSTVGGKAYSLAQLCGAGFPVPEGFVLTTDALEEVLRNPELAAAVASAMHRTETGMRDEIRLLAVRERLLATELPPAIRAELRRAVDERLGPAVPLAVRSSGTKEDLEGASFAGQYETFLNVRGEQALETAIKRCWASLFQARVLDYAEKQAGGATGLSMSVVVQKMVPSDIAGVLFTVHPVTGREAEMMIESAFGLGESLVSGRINADRFVVDATTGQTLSREISHQAFRVDPVWAGATREVELSEEEGRRASLDDAQLGELVGLGLAIQEHYGRPMDVEWAFAGGTLYALQARPITRLSFAESVGEWTTADFKDGGVSSDVCSPFMWSLYDLALERSMPQYFQDIKLLAKTDRAVWGRMFFARPYWNLGAVKSVLEKIPGFNERNFDTDLGIVPTYEGNGRTTPVSLRGVFSALPVLFALKRSYKQVLAQDQLFVQGFAAAKLPFDLGEDALAALDSPAFAQRFRALIEVLYVDTETRYFTTIYNTSNSKLDFKVHFEKAQAACAGTLDYLKLVGGLKDLSHLRPLKDMHDLLGELVLHGRVLDDETVREFAQRWRHHGQRELDIRVPRWKDDLPFVQQMLQQSLDSYDPAQDPVEQAQVQHAAYQAERDKARRALLWRPDVWFAFSRQLALVRKYAWWREEMRDHSSYAYYLVRLFTVEAARRLLAAGNIAAPDDLFYLPYPEVLALVEGALGPGEAERRIQAGRRMVRSYRNFQNPNEIGGQYRHAPPKAHAADGSVLSGTAASPGRVQARARVLKTLSEMSRVQPGDILVTVFTDPGWTPLFARIAGVVTETGGVLAHAAVISREYGIPAVLAVAGATSIIGDGDLVALDGSQGTIEILERATRA